MTAPLDAARVDAIRTHMTAEERELAERLRLSDEFRDHCETEVIGKTWGALFAFALSFARGRIWSPEDTAAEEAARQQRYEAAEAQDPWLRLKTIVERCVAAADEADEAARLAEMTTGGATKRTRVSRKDVPADKLAAAAAQFQHDNPQAGYAETVEAVQTQTGADRKSARLAMQDRPDRRGRGRRK